MFQIWLYGLLLPSILLLANVAPVNATVGIEYLGPNPLNPKPTAEAQTLADSGIIGNGGTEPARVTLTLVADDEFKAHFTVIFSDNNFTLNSGERKAITFTFKFDPNTPIQDWAAGVAIVAEAVNVPLGVSPGRASFNLQVLVRVGATTETATTSVATTLVTSEATTTAITEATTVATVTSYTTIIRAQPTVQGCVIATAAYGTEMAPEVVYMRYVRDELIGSSPTGKLLRGGFNAWYYSWSPPIAWAIAGNDALRTLSRIVLTPLVGIIHITAYAFLALGGSEVASVLAFTIAAALSISTYILVPVLLAVGTSRWITKRTNPAPGE
jgi:hypothetical protein